MTKTSKTIGMLLASACITASNAWSQEGGYPARAVRVVVPYAPGGGADTISRVYFTRLSESLAQQFVIDNRAGGSGTIGAAAVARAPADGYVILHDATGFSINPALMPKLPYEPKRDFIPVFLAGIVPNLLVVHPSIKATSVKDIIDLAKRTPEGLDWASSGNGGVQHMAMELFRLGAGIRLNHLPYKSGAPALTDLLGGHVKFYFSNAAASTGYVKAGSLKAIAHTGRQPLPTFPSLPAVADTLPGYEAYEWNGVFLPAGTPRTVVDRLSEALNAALALPTVTDRLAGLSVQARPNTPADFAAYVSSEMEKWAKVVKAGNIKIE